MLWSTIDGNRPVSRLFFIEATKRAATQSTKLRLCSYRRLGGLATRAQRPELIGIEELLRIEDRIILDDGRSITGIGAFYIEHHGRVLVGKKEEPRLIRRWKLEPLLVVALKQSRLKYWSAYVELRYVRHSQRQTAVLIDNKDERVPAAIALSS